MEIIRMKITYEPEKEKSSMKRRIYSYDPNEIRALGKGLAIGLALGTVTMLLILGVM